MATVDVPLLRCYRCLYLWHPRGPIIHMCPRCKSRLWNVPKVQPVTKGNGPGIAEILDPHMIEIVRLARKFRVKRIRVFGSVARNEATPKSDVDLLVDFDWSKPYPGGLRVPGLQIELREVLGRSVDVVTENSLHWAVRPQAVHEAVPLWPR